jgi:NDP-sugar pyrophosphorylase family protein
MQAVLLAGGLGLRLRPLTDRVPKVLAPVAGRPFIDWVIATLPREVFSEVLLLIGRLGEQIREYCGDGDRYGLPVAYCEESEPLGPAGALRNAERLLAETFVRVNGDTYLPLDYPDLLAAHTAGGALATIVVAPAYSPEIGPNLEVAEDGTVTAYEKGSPNPRLNAIDAGIAVFSRQALAHIPPSRPSREEEFYASLLAAGQLRACRHTACYYDMGTPHGHSVLEALLSTGGGGARGAG